MKRTEYNKLIDDLFKIGFNLNHYEEEYSLFSNGVNTIELNHFEGITEV